MHLPRQAILESQLVLPKYIYFQRTGGVFSKDMMLIKRMQDVKLKDFLKIGERPGQGYHAEAWQMLIFKYVQVKRG